MNFVGDTASPISIVKAVLRDRQSGGGSKASTNQTCAHWNALRVPRDGWKAAVMGKFSRDKGARNERKLVNMIQSHGIDAKRVPLSGAADGFKGDIIMGQWTIEAKLRADGFKQIYDWIDGDSDLLVIGRDRSPPLAVLDLRDLLDILAGRHTKTIDQIRLHQAKWGD